MVFELDNKLLTPEIISKDYQILQNADMDSSTKTIILFLCTTLKDKKTDKNLLKKLVLVKQASILNNETVRTMLERFIHHYAKSSANKILGKIVYNNPESKLTERAFASGEIRDWLSPDSLLTVGKIFYEIAPERSIHIIYYLKALNNLESDDSLKTIKQLSEKLINRFMKQEHLRLGIDMNNHLLLLKSFIFEGFVRACEKFNEQQYGIETLRKYEKFNKDYEYEKFTYYY